MVPDLSFQSRRPYFGSCHCGDTQYVIHLSFPPAAMDSQRIPPKHMLICKCNCSTCHKMGMFHLRLESAPNDFFLISPTDLQNGKLTDYTRLETRDPKKVHWYFCKTCGVRCFAFMGMGETVALKFETVAGSLAPEGQRDMIQVWRPKRDGWDETDRQGVVRPSFLSVNALTLEPDQEGFDLREWAEKEWIYYKDGANCEGQDRLSIPHEGGCY